MATEKQEKLIARHLRDYGQLIQAEAEKMEILGIETNPSLFDKAREIYYLADEVGTKIKVIYEPNAVKINGSAISEALSDNLN
jgi:hypothetical protein